MGIRKSSNLGLILLFSSICLSFLIQQSSAAAVFSIDFGSEWMKVGIVSPGLPMEIALNKESKRKTPSVIAFREKSRFFGDEAVTLSARFPASSYAYLLDLLGKDINNPVVENYRKRFPYYNIQADPIRNTVTFKNGDDVFTVEELVSQLLSRAQQFAQDATGQLIQECVIVVPGFFGQAERVAMLAAAQLANLKVLQLMNDYTAVALNYGIFQRKNFNETAQYMMFYDMGASKTTATIVSFQLVKDKVLRETLPVVQVIGVGYDRTLGGLEMQLRLRDHLAKAFNDMKKTSQNVYDSPRALAKLLKEAGRVKNVLSANVDHFAQIEGLLDEQDFKFMVTREVFENLNSDLFERAAAPIQKALDAAGLTMDVINQVVLFGGNTRTPKIQEIIKKKVGMELAKNLNADEAAVMGAVYRAADLGTGFKVKKFIVKDAVLFPIHVVFERESGNKKSVTRTLFGAMNTYPQKKVITFNKHKQNFDFAVNYADVDYLGANEVASIGLLNISKHHLTSVTKLYEEKVTEGVEAKGIKAHFALDDSGIFSLLNSELVLEKTIEKNPVEEEGAFSKLGSTISKLFGGDSTKEVNDTAKPTEETTDTPPSSNDSTEVPPTSTELPTNETLLADEPAKNETATDNKPKIVTVKESIDSTSEFFVTKTLEEEGDQFKESKKRILDFEKFEKEKLRRENAVNELETKVIEAQERLDREEYASCATESEKEEILNMCNEIGDWIYEDGIDAEVQIFEEKLETLKKKTNEVYARHWEHEERPEALKALDGMLNGSEGFLATARNVTKDPEKSNVFSEKEVEDLAKAIQEVKEWRDKEVEAQAKLARNEPVKLTVKQITDKMAFLDREVKYLVNKIKAWRPKEKPKEKKKKKRENNETSSDSVEGSAPTSEGDEEPAAIVEDAETQEEPPVTEKVETKEEESAKVEQIDPEKPQESKDDDHSEL